MVLTLGLPPSFLASTREKGEKGKARLNLKKDVLRKPVPGFCVLGSRGSTGWGESGK